MIKNSNFSLISKYEKPIDGDVTFQPNKLAKPLVIFCHGYKGFKDWGAWQLIADAFAEAGFFFVKFNFSHNGININQPTEFTDLEAFGNDNYSKQLEDLNLVINFFEGKNEFSEEINFLKLSLIGHSRGGGICILQAHQDTRVKKLITWAGVSDFGNRFPRGKKLEQWKKEGVYHIVNGRTKQKIPHFIQFYEDFLANQKKLHIKTAVQKLHIPFLIIHGTHDESVDAQEAEILFDNSSSSRLKWIANANHVFGMKHPWEENKLPKQTHILIEESLKHLNE